MAANKAIINEATFASFGLRTFFEDYTDELDLLEDTMDAVLVYAECVKVLFKSWKGFDWKSRIDW